MFKYYEDVIRQMERELEEMAQQAFLRQTGHQVPQESIWQPRTDVYECTDRLVIRVELAGVDPKRIELTLSPDSRQLIIRGPRMESQDEAADRVRCYQLEIYYGTFERVVRLPPDLRLDRDNLDADYANGMLTVSLPKRPIEAPITVAIEP
ncbi:MAG TPA: Hsp20/alpha crystallin family protein [Armatimonadota bacterium]